MKCLRCLSVAWLAFIAGLMLLFGAAGCNERAGQGTTPPQPEDAVPPPDFSSEVKEVLRRKTALVEELAANPAVLEAVKASNEKNRNVTESEISRLDAKWQETEGLDEFIESFITNPCAQLLADFQETNDGFPEIFVTDEKGLIVAETNKTSDYNQKDESWWTATWNDGRGKTHHGAIEYDDSAMSEAISIYVPVLDPQSGNTLGVIKAVCDVTAIKMEL